MGGLSRITLQRYAAKEDGGASVLSLFLFVATAMVGGLALDYTGLVAARIQLQTTADVAAHGALYHRENNSPEAARSKAIGLAQVAMPVTKFGEVITAEDIHFGHWDYDTQAFTVDEESRSATLVTTRRSESRSNSVASYLFRLLGIDSFDVSTQAVFVTYRPACFREGFVAEGVVDIQSNNTFSNGFCIHSNTYVSVNQNNTYEPGTIVSMPDADDIDLPSSGFDKNAGLEEALHSAAYRMRIISGIDPLIAGLAAGDRKYLPDYITDPAPIHLTENKLTDTHFTSGRIHILECSRDLTISSAVPITEVVIMADCEVKFGQGTMLEDVVLTNTSSSLKSFSAPSSLQVGRNDSCSEGGGAQLVTRGGVSFAADLSMYGGQIIAARTVQFSANADGVQGASIVSGETIEGTSNMAMGFCNGSGMEDNFEANYFRLAR